MKRGTQIHEPQEKVLMDHLFKNYNKSLRPSETVGQPVNMTFGIAYVQLVELDDKDQVCYSLVKILFCIMNPPPKIYT